MRYCFLAILLGLFFSMPVHAATEKRVALVIGNSEYSRQLSGLIAIYQQLGELFQIMKG
jgi:hypothetical protein